MLRTFILLVMVSFLQNLATSQSRLTIKVEELDKVKGELFIGLYNSESTFKNTDSVYIEKYAPVDSTTVFVYQDSLPDGYYAISMFHDEDSNGKLKKGFFGQPTEKFGFSNNPRVIFKAPGFDKCKFLVARDTTIVIRMKGF